MKIKNILDNDEYFSEKKDKVMSLGKYLKHHWYFLLAIFTLTFVASLTTFTATSYFNSNSQMIEAIALTEYSDDINEITLRSRIRNGTYPNDIFASPDDRITYLQTNYTEIKTFKVYRAYEPYRGTDMINGFYYMGNPEDKPESTYYDRFNDDVRMYTNFLCVDNGDYLGIGLEYSANAVTVNDTNEDGVVIGSHVEQRFMTGYIGNEIYLPYDFASNVLLPQYQNGYFGNNEDMELEDLINKEFVLFSVISNRLATGGTRNGQVESPITYIIKGITRDDTEEAFRDYFILPFNKSMLTQPRVHFKASTDASINNSYMSVVKKNNSSNSSLVWGISTRFTAPLSSYVNTNTPAKFTGVFLSLTLLLLIADGYIYYLYLKNVNKKDKDAKIRVTSICSVIAIFLACLFGGAIAKVINSSSLFAWPTSVGKLKTVFFSTASSTINSVISLILIIGAVIAATKFLKYYNNKNQEDNENQDLEKIESTENNIPEDIKSQEEIEQPKA